MNYKIFLVGAVCGAAAVAAVDWLLLGAHLPHSDDERIAEIAANSNVEAIEADRNLLFEDPLPNAPSESVQPETPSAATEGDVNLASGLHIRGKQIRNRRRSPSQHGAIIELIVQNI